MTNYLTTDFLNLRKTAEKPASDPSINLITTLPPNTVVENMAEKNIDKWYYIQTYIANTLTEGFASKLYLEVTNRVLHPPIPVAANIPAVHLPVKNKIIARSQTDGRAFPLNEGSMVIGKLKDLQEIQDRKNLIENTLDFLNVENSLRYSPTNASTYCNIYAYDVSYCVGAYIPRVWWNDNALTKIKAGQQVPVEYETSVKELNANSLTSWFENYGTLFGWKRVLDIDELQALVNGGTLGIIVAQRIDLNRSGHIVAVVPESETNKAARNGTLVISPLQSQAGARNKKYFTSNNWWTNTAKFRKSGMWVMEI